MSQQAKSKIHGASNAGWMLTFADLLSLLLTFFVLVFSMSTIQYDSWKSVVDTMREQFNAAPDALTQRRFEDVEAAATLTPKGLNLNYLRALIETSVAQNSLFADATIRREADRLVVALPASRLFEDKSGQLLPGAADAVGTFAVSLIQFRNRMTVASHTNNLPVTSGRYRSNWELSVSRARLIAGVLVDAGYLLPVTVLGHGDSKFQLPAGARATVAQLDAQERIEFVIMAEGRDRGPFDVF